MEITEIECKILRIKAGAILILGMQLLEMKKMDANTSDTTGHQEDSNNTSDAGDAPLSESALNEMEKNAEQNQ